MKGKISRDGGHGYRQGLYNKEKRKCQKIVL